MEAERSVSDSLLWAVFLTPFLEQGPAFPEDFKDLRDFVHQGIKEALGGIEFPRQRHDDVSQILALEARVAPLLRARRPVPARQARLALYPEAWLLYQIKEAPEAELLERMRPGTAPAPAAPAQGRQTAAPHRDAAAIAGRGQGERGGGERKTLGERAKGRRPLPLQKTPPNPLSQSLRDKGWLQGPTRLGRPAIWWHRLSSLCPLSVGRASPPANLKSGHRDGRPTTIPPASPS